MPRGDRSGPSGEGPKTGRGMGYCTGNEHPGYMNTFSNRGRGYGRGFHGGFGYGQGAGFGFRYGSGNYYQGGVADVSEKTLIENEIRILKDQMSALEERLSKTDKK
jgi:hypothetical protein